MSRRESEKEAAMRQRVSVFVESTEETKEMFPEEIRTAIKAAFRAVRAFIGKVDAKFIN